MEKTEKIKLIHTSGTEFYVFLNEYELARTQTDANFRNELIDKYYQLYKRGLVSSISQVYTDETSELSAISSDNNNNEDTDTRASIPLQKGDRFIWCRAAINLLLTEIEGVKDQLLLPHKKRKLFGLIAKKLNEHGYAVTWESCERKWRGLQNTYKNIVHKENNSGSGSLTWEFYDNVADIVSNDPCHRPPIKVSVGSANESVVEVVPRKRSKKNDENVEITETLSLIQQNVENLQSSINKLAEVQEQRNIIFERLTCAIEKIAGST